MYNYSQSPHFLTNGNGSRVLNNVHGLGGVIGVEFRRQNRFHQFRPANRFQFDQVLFRCGWLVSAGRNRR